MSARWPTAITVVATIALCACGENAAPAAPKIADVLNATIYAFNIPAGSWNMGTCMTLQLRDSVTDAAHVGVTPDSVAWTITDTTIATISATGLLSAWKPGLGTVKVTAWRAGTTVATQNDFTVANPFDPLPWHPCITTFSIAPSRTISMQTQQELDLTGPPGPGFLSPPQLTGASLTFIDVSYPSSFGSPSEQLFRFKSGGVGTAILTFTTGAPGVAPVVDTIVVVPPSPTR